MNRIARLRQDDTHRLVPSVHVERDRSILNRLIDDPEELGLLFELEGATNDRIAGEAGLLPGITVRELVFDLPYSHIVNAAFTHAHPAGSRFNSPDRGAWYAAFSIETAGREVAYHKSLELQEIDWREKEAFTFVDFLADFRGEFHDLRRQRNRAGYLNPDSYAASQQLATELLGAGSCGIVYPSVRHSGGTCLACFRPALVNNVRKGSEVAITFDDAYASPRIRVRRKPKKVAVEQTGAGGRDRL